MAQHEPVRPAGGPPPGVHPKDWAAVPAIPGLDPGIAPIVRVLRAHGVETCESCDGGPGHASFEPFVNVLGDDVFAGWHALSVALAYGFEPRSVARVWHISRGAPTQPVWRLTFRAEDVGRASLWDDQGCTRWFDVAHRDGRPRWRFWRQEGSET